MFEKEKKAEKMPKKSKNLKKIALIRNVFVDFELFLKYASFHTQHRITFKKHFQIFPLFKIIHYIYIAYWKQALKNIRSPKDVLLNTRLFCSVLNLFS